MVVGCIVFFCKQKTAYELRISDWSSDVCSSDLLLSEFPQKAIDEAEAAAAAPLGSRQDLCDVPLVTIDGADARDFDDAVFAEPDDDPKNPCGWHLLTAIADAAPYVRPDIALDRPAPPRGNSTPLSSRVPPLLPPAPSQARSPLHTRRTEEGR